MTDNEVLDMVDSRVLSPRRVDLWIARLGSANEAMLSCEYRSLLTPEEREREMRFHFEADRRRYLVTRALVRTTLSLYVPCAPTDWRFSPSQYGRPKIVCDSGGGAISFNLSHTDGMIVLAVTGGPEVGVDVENRAACAPPVEIADRFFALEEVLNLRHLPEEEKAFRFWEYWTLKESYIKALGTGLSTPLDSFYFRLNNEGTMTLHGRPTLADRLGRWRLWQFVPAEPFLAALCVEDVGQQPEICQFEVMPLVSIRPVPFIARRRSVSEPTKGE